MDKNNNKHIKNHESHSRRAGGGVEAVLARRLAAATIISLNNPKVIDRLPLERNVYSGYKIPTVEESKQLLLKGTGACKERPMYIVAGVDEVQLLNEEYNGIGSMFLGILRQWQSDWFNDVIRIVPLGTGIAILDWSAVDEGINVPLRGSDATLVSKADFAALVCNTVHEKLGNNTFNDRGFNEETWSRDTLIDLIIASYWPRVRLLQWWRDGNFAALRSTKRSDSNASAWVHWLCHWMRDETINIQKRELIPGRNKDKPTDKGSIHCLFQLGDSVEEFSVIPDGFCSSSLVLELEIQLMVDHLYRGLDAVKSLNPSHFILNGGSNAKEFEDFGFHVVGTAIHVGIHALYKKEIIQVSKRTNTQCKRLGLAFWFADNNAITHSREDDELLQPRVLGVDSTDLKEEYYPFESMEQTSFCDTVKAALQQAVHGESHRPVYIRCGQNTICDYMYFYLRETTSNEGGAGKEIKLLALLADAKHTRDDSSGNSSDVTSNKSEEGLAGSNVGYSFGVRINRDRLAIKPQTTTMDSALKDAETATGGSVFM